MRFDELTVEKYGAYNELTLALADQPGLVVVYGPNEAGKSTCLSAISDFLFGISHSSAYGQLYGYDAILLRAELRLASGERRSLRRRKGRAAKTLSDGSGNLVDESALSSLLGAVTRPQFTSLFALDHEALREGGRQLLASDGKIGRLIVEAGGGLRTLIQRVEQVGEQADACFTPRRAENRAFYRELDRFNVAERQVRDSIVTRDDYESARRKYETARKNLDDLRTQQSKMQEQLYRDKRLVQVIPLLAELASIEQRVQSFADLPPLSAGFARVAREAVGALDRAQQALAEVEERRAGLEAKLGGLVIPLPLLGAAAKIRDIAEKAVQIRSERAARPNRQTELTQLEVKLTQLRQSVGVGPDANLMPLLPGASALERVQKLHAAGLKLRPLVQAATTKAEECGSELETLERYLAEQAQAGQDRPFGVSASEFSALPKDSRTLETKRRQAGKIEQDLAQRLRGIEFSTVAVLRAFLCPDALVIQSEIDRQGRLEAELLKCSERLAEQNGQKESAGREIEQLKQGGEVPTEAVITSVRRERDDAWAGIRDVYLSNDAQAIVAVPMRKRAAAVVGFEGRVRDADQLADRKSVDAQRIATLTLLEKQREQAAVAIGVSGQRKAELEAAIVQAAQRWQDAWPAAFEAAPDLGRLKELVAERSLLLTRAQELSALQAEIEQLAADVEPRMDALALAERQLTLRSPSGASLTERIQIVTQRITAHDDVYRSFLAARKELATLRTQLDQRKKELVKLQEQESVWDSQWKTAVVQIGLPEGVAPDRASEIARQWGAATGILDGIELTQRRLRRMDEDEAELKQLLASVAGQLEFQLPSDSLVAATLLEDKLKEANKAATQREILAPQVVACTSERDRKQRARDAAAERVTVCCREAGCEEALLLLIAERHEQLGQAEELRRQAIEKILSAGDGKSVESLQQQCLERDIDVIRADLCRLEADAKGLDDLLAEAAGSLRDEENTLARYRGEQGINHAVAERERAAAEMHRTIEKYVSLSLARELLSTAIQRLRGEQQDPLIKRAGELFAMATRGAFVGIETDIDAKGNPIVIGRRSGSDQKVTSQVMSEGTRDQLFLAFRIASIEEYCRAAEPLPFIADDLLVHFDDARSRATLELLAELGRTTQVLLFTHHQSVMEAARQVGQQAGRTDRVGCVELSGA